MSIRIPKTIDRAVDAVTRRPLVTLAAAALGASAAVFAWQPSLALLVVSVAAAYLTGATQGRGRIDALRAETAELHRANGFLLERLRHVERGDASATTAQIITIPEDGDR